MKINYKIDALDVLLNKNCLLVRYYPLIELKKELIKYFVKIKCFTKNDCLQLDDNLLMDSPLNNINNVKLLKKFLTLYDVNNQKFKELDLVSIDEEEKINLKQLFLLPGVKSTRALLYYNSGFKSLDDIAKSSADEIQDKTSKYIINNKLDLKVPLLKEVATHIAVATAFTLYGCN